MDRLASPDHIPAPQAFARHGIHRDDRVLLLAPNSPALLTTVLGCLAAGIAPALVSPTSTPREIEEMSTDIDAAAVLRDDEIRAIAASPETVAFTGRVTCRPIHFTSGTSGRPKAVWSGWLTPETAQAWIDDETAAWSITAADTHLVCGPLHHSAPLRFALMTLLNRGTVLTQPQFDPAAIAQALSRVTTTFMAPVHLQRLMVIDHPIEHTLRLLAHAGAACPDHVRRWAHDTFGRDVVVEFYGSTEGQFTICPARESEQRPGTVGRARPGRTLRVDGTNQLWCQPPSHARFTYWNDDVATAAAWQGDWFTVGDLGHIDDNGYVFLHGRAGDLIISGGVNVYPAEIERVLAELPGVIQSAAFGVPDDEWGERVCVAVIGTATEEAIRDHLTANLAPAKRPKTILRVKDLPLTHTGKVHRAKLVNHVR